MITKGGLYHRPDSNFSYGYHRNCLHIRVRALKGEVKKAVCRIGDPFIWESGGAGGNLEAVGAKGWKCQELPMVLEATTEYHDYFFVSVDTMTKRSRYAFILEGEDEKLLMGERRIVDLNQEGVEHELSDLRNFYCFPYISGRDVLTVPTWAKETVWYQIFPERFANGDTSNDPVDVEPWGTEPTWSNHMGGDIQGIIDHLDYLVNLGITGIHFCPLFHGDANHKYMTIDYMAIDPQFGTNELFKTLVNKAHAKGIKVMLDGVFNHCGDNHPFFQDVLQKGEESKYSDWFCIDEFPVKYKSYETFATIGQMPKMNFENDEVIEYFLEVGRYWIEEYGIDGWRLDVANEVSHEFWRLFRREMKKVNPETFILGEVWHDALPWIGGDQYDSVMHYPLTDACTRFFAKDLVDLEAFQWLVNHLSVHYPKNAIESAYNILGSHDTSRFLAEANENTGKLLLAYAFLMTQPGTPSLYYGDEIGMTGSHGMNQEYHRRCMVWDQDHWDHHVYDVMKDLIRLHKEYIHSWKEPLQWLNVSCSKSGKPLTAYRKDNLLVIMNHYSDEIVLEGYSQYQILLSSEKRSTLSKEQTLKPYEFIVFRTV